MPELSLELRTWIVAKTYATIHFHFAHWQSVPPDFDLDREIQDLMQTALHTPDRRDFGLAMMRFIGRLNNAHCWYRDPWMQEEMSQPLAYLLRPLGDQFMIAHSFLDGLQPGDVITHLDGKPILDVYNEIRPYIAASSERGARQLAAQYLHMFVPQRYDVRLDDGREVEIDHSRATPLTQIPERHAEGKWLVENQVAYIHIPRLNPSYFEDEALALVHQYKDAACIIFDVRGNGGGTTPSKLIEALMDRPYSSWAESTPVNFGLFRYRHEEAARQSIGFNWDEDYTCGYYDAMSFFNRPSLMWHAPVVQPKAPVFTGQVILLVDADVASGAEDFVVAFKNSGRGLLIGEATYGSTGQPYHYWFEHGIWLAIGTKRAYFPDGSAYEGVGIQPDIELMPTLDDIRSGRDVVLERALQVAG